MRIKSTPRNFSNFIDALIIIAIITLVPILQYAEDAPTGQTNPIEVDEFSEIENSESEDTIENDIKEDIDTAAKISLPQLNNQELLQQFQQTLDSLQNRSRITSRTLKETEFLLEKTKTDTQQLTLPVEPNVQDLDASETDKVNLDYRQATFEALKQQLTAHEAEKALLDQYNQQLSEALTTLNTLAQESKKLDEWLLQVQLRLDEGSLSKESIPKGLDKPQVEQFRQSLADEQMTVTAKVENLKTVIEAAIKALEDSKKKVTEAESAQKSAQERYNQTQKRRELEQTYAKKSLKKLHEELMILSEERAWVYSTLKASLKDFLAQRTTEQEMAKELEKLGSPPEKESEEPDNDQYFKDLDSYHKNRLTLLKTHQVVLENLIKKSDLLFGDAKVLSEYLFKMRVIADVFERLQKEQNNASLVLLPELTAEAIKKYDEDLVTRIAELSGIIASAQEQLTTTAQLQTQSTDAIAQVEQSLIHIQKAREALLELQKWEADLKKQSPDEIIKKFSSARKELLEKSQNLDKKRSKFKEIELTYTEINNKLATLQDPFVRELQTQKQIDEYEMLKQLYQFAGLEPPKLEEVSTAVSPQVAAMSAEAAPVANAAASAVASAPPATSPNLAEASSSSAVPSQAQTVESATPPVAADAAANLDTATAQPATPPKPVEDPDAVVIAYQGQLSSWLRIAEEQARKQAELLEILTQLESQIQVYLSAVEEVYQLTQQQQTTALEIKKRVGRNELTVEQVPEGVTEALKQEQLQALSEERTSVRNRQLLMQDEIARLKRTDEVSPKVLKFFEETSTFTGKLLDALQQAHKLELDFQLDQNALGAVERKILEQSTLRRIKAENSIFESMLGFFESKEIAVTTEILQARYLDLTEQESKQRILTTWQEKYKNAVLYLQEEKKIMSQLITLLQEKLTKLKDFQEEETVKNKARIAPDRAKELLAAFESAKGMSLVPLPALTESERTTEITIIAKYLFNLDMQVQALEKWIALFQTRTSAEGIDAQIGNYQDVIAKLDTKGRAIERKIAGLIGFPAEEVAKLTPEEQPTTSEGWALLMIGEIGVLRADRFTLYSENIYMIIVKAGLVLLSGFLFLLLANLIFKYWLIRASKDLESGKRTDTTILSVLSLSRKVLRFFIIAATFILCLDALGFNTGTILAGLGIGGIAVAMASKEILADIFGGITIMTMGIYRINDLISYKGTWYVVKEIGIRHTELEDFSYNYRVSMPNGKMLETEVVNISSHPGYTVLKNIYLSTTNNAEKIKLALTLIEELVKEHSGARFIWVKHHHFDDYSFVLRLHYDIRKFKERNRVESDLNAEIVKRFQEHGIHFTPLPGLPPEFLGLEKPKLA